MTKYIVCYNIDDNVFVEHYDDIVKATSRYEELALKHPVSLGLYKLIDSL